MSVLSQIKYRFALRGPKLKPLDRGLDAAAQWIARAQDIGTDDGVAAFYDTRRKTWKASYPETTGYIIPTLYKYATRRDSQEYYDRATRMAVWECDIQLPGGGVRAGQMDADTVAPTIFNTGQVLFGWASAYEQTGQTRFAESLKHASDWLVDAQDDDGAWRRFGSPFAGYSVNTYNTRVAFGLARAARVLDDERYAKAARANVEWALTQARANGWFANNDLENNAQPLTHTIAYATRGILEVGALLDIPAYIQQAQLTAGQVAATQRADGALPGRLDSAWRAKAGWSCLTGNAQMAIIWLRLAALTDDMSWIEPARQAIAFLQTRQAISHTDPGRRGGIAGSAPERGHYMRYSYPNWAAKFYMDAVMQLVRANG